MLWTPVDREVALLVAATRITCIVLAVLVMAALAICIYPAIASEQVPRLLCPIHLQAVHTNHGNQQCLAVGLGLPKIKKFSVPWPGAHCCCSRPCAAPGYVCATCQHRQGL